MVTGRKPSLWLRVVAVLTSLVALWAFAAYVTVGEGVSLAWLAILETRVGKPTEALVAALQEERRLSVEFGATGVLSGRSTLDNARRATDAAIDRQRKGMESLLGRWSTSKVSDDRLGDLLKGLETLPSQRSLLDAGRMGRTTAAQYFTDLIQLGSDVYESYLALDDRDILYSANTILLLTQGQEIMSREDALMAGVIGANVFEAADRQSFAELVGAQRFLARQISERLPEPDRNDYAQALSGPTMQALRLLETEIAMAPTGRAPAALTQWRAAVGPAIEAMRGLVILFADRTVQRARPAAIWIVVRLILAAGLGLIAVIASIRFTIRTLRRLQKQLAELRVAALDLAHKRLPRVVDLLRRGEEVDVGKMAPPLAFGADDIGLVGQAFNTVQETAIQATVDQAELKRSVRDIFLSLAHRIQTLVHRQLKLIDYMERHAASDGELASLYRIDHLATRMRRNAENLIVLAGMPPARTWRGPVPVVDVIRAAIAEVDDYQRVKLRSADPATLSGRAVGDVIHLFAELMENAVSFSPPQANVHVTGISVHDGYLVEIEDRGLGMTEDDLLTANFQIAHPPDFQLTSSVRLGFFVVGRLAQRYGVRVILRPSPNQGVTAAILLPLDVLGDDADEMNYLPETIPAALPGSEPDSQPDSRYETAFDTSVEKSFEQSFEKSFETSFERSFETPLETVPDTVPETLWKTVPAVNEPVGRLAQETRFTKAGLPVRVRRPVAVAAHDEIANVPTQRTPQEVGRMFAAYAAAAKRGEAETQPSTGRYDHRD
jgi:signal transduction histidine kinase